MYGDKHRKTGKEETVLISIFAALSLLASIICFTLGIIVYLLNKKATLNRLFALTVFVSGYWAFTEFMTRQASSLEVAYFWNKAIFIWPFFTAFLLNFTLTFTENRFRHNKSTYLILYALPTVFSLVNLFTSQMVDHIELAYWGYTAACSTSWIGIIANFWSGTFALLSIVLCIRYYKKSKDELKKQQTKFITVGFTIPLLTFFIQTWLPSIGLSVPEFGNTFSAFMSIFVAYAIWKYHLFQLDPESPPKPP